MDENQAKIYARKIKMSNYQQKYRLAHLDKAKEAGKTYKDAHKLETKEYNKEYYQKTREERLKEMASQRKRTDCECGGRYCSNHHFLRHQKSKKHLRYLEKKQQESTQ
jgi:hypothetical protein